jgi:hypothetical protein
MSDLTPIRGIFCGDLVIKTMIELGLEDIKKNPWLIEDVFASLRDNELLSKKYGEKEVQRTKEFISNNDLPVFMQYRIDKQSFPCITISLGESNEDKSLATLGDTTPFVEELNPNDIGKPIPFIVQPFNAVSYDKTTGIVEVPADIENYRYIEAGMAVVNAETGGGFTIIEKAGINGFKIAINSELPTNKKIAIIPQYRIYRARREGATLQESYQIGCHVSGDPAYLIMLFSVIKYIIYRYREALLEHENFQLSGIKCSQIIKNNEFGEDKVFSRFITLYGQTIETWIKSPHRVIESTEFKDTDNPTLPGIKVLAQEAPESVKEEVDQNWVTIEDDEE